MKHSFWLSSMFFLLILINSSCKKDPISPMEDLNKTTVIDCNESTFPLVWKKKNGLDVDYIVKCELEVPRGQTLLIEPGVRVKFEGSNAAIYASEGALKMVGTAALPIILEGVVPVKGSWRGVFISSNIRDNQLEYVTIRHAGSSASFWLSDPCGLGFEIPTDGVIRISIANCTFEQNDGYGIGSRSDGLNLERFENNVFRNNTLAPVLLPSFVIDKIATSNSYENNGLSHIAIYSEGFQYTPDRDITIQAASLPYRFKSDLRPARNMKINPGAILEFEADKGIIVDGSTASMTAVGTPGSPIIFRGVLPGLRGQWRGIFFNSGNPLNQLEHCQVLGGGGNFYWTYFANIEIFYNSRVNINACQIRDSGGYGITYSSDSPNVIITNNVYSNNADQDVLIH